jgi:hypothetical protein
VEYGRAIETRPIYWAGRPSFSCGPLLTSGSFFFHGGFITHVLVLAFKILLLISLNLLYSSTVAKYSRLFQLSNVVRMVTKAASERCISTNTVSTWYHLTFVPISHILQSSAYRYRMSSRSSRIISLVTYRRLTALELSGLFSSALVGRLGNACCWSLPLLAKVGCLCLDPKTLFLARFRLWRFIVQAVE